MRGVCCALVRSFSAATSSRSQSAARLSLTLTQPHQYRLTRPHANNMSTVTHTPADATHAITPQYCTSHFVTGEYRPVVSFLDDESYARCLDTLVKACNDMLLTHRGKVFLGKRQVWPQRDHWYGCGGRMKPGESIFEASRRLLMREIKIELPVEELKKRLQTVGHYSFVWGKREQLPQTNGTADISVVVTMELSDDELNALKPDEFEIHSWVTPNEILIGDYHPALKRSMQDYIQLKRLQELDALVIGGERLSLAPQHPLPDGSTSTAPSAATPAASSAPITDAEIVAACRQFLQYRRFISQNDTDTVPCKETQ